MVLEWVIFPSFSRLYSLILKTVSAYPKHCVLHRAGKIIFVKNLVCFLNLLTLESWCCCNLVTAKISAISKTREFFPWFKSAFVYLLYNVIFDLVTADEFLEIFIAFKNCRWFVLKIFFRDFLTGFLSNFSVNFNDAF